MAYIDGYDYDIFISHSHNDNAASAGRKGWVTEFLDYLRSWLIKKRHLKGLEIWMDAELDGNTVFDQAIEYRISRSALFVVLFSDDYQESAYCRKELAWFFQHNQRRPEGLMVGDDSRLLNLLINDQWSGRLIDDLEEQTYPRLQDESAAHSRTPSLIWVPDSLAEDEIEDEEQAAWLKQMEQDERSDAQFQFIRSGRQALIDQVLQTVAAFATAL